MCQVRTLEPVVVCWSSCAEFRNFIYFCGWETSTFRRDLIVCCFGVEYLSGVEWSTGLSSACSFREWLKFKYPFNCIGNDLIIVDKFIKGSSPIFFCVSAFFVLKVFLQG